MTIQEKNLNRILPTKRSKKEWKWNKAFKFKSLTKKRKPKEGDNSKEKETRQALEEFLRGEKDY